MSTLIVGDRQRPNHEYLARVSVGTLLPDACSTPFDGVRAVYALPHRDVATEQMEVGTTIAAAACQLRLALERTLDRYLARTKTVAVLTGGGLDSGGLLALVSQWARRHGRAFFAVAMDFEAGGDDRPYLRALEGVLRCKVVRVAPEDGAKFDWALTRGVDHAPLQWATAAMELAAYSRAKDEGADCVLTGAGGDAVFDGRPRSLAGFVREGRPFAALRSVSRLKGFHRPRHPALTWLARPLILEAFPKMLRARVARTTPVPMVPWAGPITLRCLDEERLRRRREVGNMVLRRGRSQSNLELVFARHRQQVALATGLVRRLDPLLDHSLQVFVSRIPEHWLLAGDRRRGLFREALKDVLPVPLYRRLDKSDFEPALIRFVHALGGFERLAPWAKGRVLADFGIVEPKILQAEFDRFVANPLEGSYWLKIWPALIAEAFALVHFG